MEVKLLSMKFSKLIDKENVLLDGKRLTDFNSGNSLNRKIDSIMWDFLYERVQEMDRHDILLIKTFVEEIKKKL